MKHEKDADCRMYCYFGEIFLLSWTRHIGKLVFPSCQLHKFLALKLSQFYGWLSKKFHLWNFNEWMDDEAKLVVLTHKN
jgi:hypothetical protein